MLAAIRKAQASDTDQLILLLHEHASFEGALISPRASFKEDLLKLLYDESKIQCLVLEQEDNILAYATFMVQYSTWDAGHYLYLDCLYVKKEFRGCGFGSRLMDSIGEWARMNKLNQVQWQTPADNEKAIMFYRKIGAVDKSKSRFFWAPRGQG